MSHGRWGYSKGCRCTGCTITHREQARKRRAQKPCNTEPWARRAMLEALIRQQEKEMRLRASFQPPEHPQGMSRVASYTAWAYERGGGRFE